MIKSNLYKILISRFILCCIGVITLPSLAAQYSIKQAIATAQAQDPWIMGNLKRQESLQAMGDHSGALPDPKISFNVANMPIDSFDLSQEPMTQIQVGYSQVFPRGQTRNLQLEKYDKLSQAQPFAREDRKASVALLVAQIWLEIYRMQKTIHIIEQDRGLFEHLVDVAQSTYTTTAKRTRQQDFVRAQLEMTRLEDRLIQLYQQRDNHLARLSEWLSDTHPSILVRESIPINIPLDQADLVLDSEKRQSQAELTQLLLMHPKIKSIDQKISAAATNVQLAKQSYKPQWGLNANYGYRDDDPLGNSRADFFSVGVTLEVPLFGDDHHSSHVHAASAQKEVEKTERTLILRKFKADYESTRMQYMRLLDRQALYQTRLLREMKEQSESALTAFTHDDGDFAEVARAQIAVLNSHIDAMNIEVDIQKAIAQLNYYFAGSSHSQKPGQPEDHHNDH